MHKLMLLLIVSIVCLAAASQPNIVQAEYYLDNDPGFGSGVNIPVTAGTVVTDKTFTVSIGSLPSGLHGLFLRSKNALGHWGLTNQLFFFKPSGATSSIKITKAEYYFDNDPGFGLATNIPLTAAADLQAISFEANLENLTPGMHLLFLRSSDEQGLWSVTNSLLYFKKPQRPAEILITQAEYYFDNDPGFGFATAIPINAGAIIQDAQINASIQFLNPGLHLLNVRSSDEQGLWSLTNQLVFFKPQPGGGPITAIEYFYDSEPGFGHGVPIAINPITNLADYLVPMNITGLPTGDHLLFMRSKNANGWSITNIFPFVVNTAAPTPFININSVTDKNNCSYDQFRISFHATGNYLPDNKFTVQLSDVNGTFNTPINIGQISSQISSEISCMLPSHLANSAAYRVRVISSNNAVTGIANLDPITIHDRPSIGYDTTVFIVCANETLDLLPLYNTTGLVSNWNVVSPIAAPAGNHRLIVTDINGCKDSALATVKQDIVTWTGTISSNWHVAANWQGGKVPTLVSHVMVMGESPNNCVISVADGEAASVQLKNGSNITLGNNRKLLVNGNCNPLPAPL